MSRFNLAVVVALSLMCSFAYGDTSMGMKVSGQTSLWRLSKVIGVQIYSGQQEKIGKIADVMIDQDGVVKSVVISVVSNTGSGEHLVSVGLEVLRFPNSPISGTVPTDAVNDRWFPDHAVLNTTMNKLLAMPRVEF